jgi:hypothetical protein
MPGPSRHSNISPQTLPPNNNDYKNEDLMNFDAFVSNEKTEKLKSALPHLYEAKPSGECS